MAERGDAEEAGEGGGGGEEGRVQHEGYVKVRRRRWRGRRRKGST